MKQEIINIIRKFHLTNEIKTYDQCAEEILLLFGVVGRSELLRAFADYAQKRIWEDDDKDLSEFVEDFESL